MFAYSSYFWTTFSLKPVGVYKIDTSLAQDLVQLRWDVRLKAALVQVGCLFGPSKSFTGLGIQSCS